MSLKNNLNNFFRNNERGIFISWIILFFYVAIDKIIKSQIYPVSDWTSFIGNTTILVIIILGLSYLSSYLIKDFENQSQISTGFFRENLYWIVPTIYLILAIILRLAYTNSFDPKFLEEISIIPILGSIISFF